jgi:hypothetical protein
MMTLSNYFSIKAVGDFTFSEIVSTSFCLSILCYCLLEVCTAIYLHLNKPKSNFIDDYEEATIGSFPPTMSEDSPETSTV